MKRLSVFCLLLMLSFSAVAMTKAAAHYYSKDVLFWRYWEVGADRLLHPKILVYNKSDKPVTFFLKKQLGKYDPDSSDYNTSKYLEMAYKITNDTIVKPVSIAAHGYQSFDLLVLPRAFTTDAIFINGNFCGALASPQPINIDRTLYKYYSTEGFRQGLSCLVAKNRLIATKGESDTLFLTFDCAQKSNNEKSWEIQTVAKSGIDQMLINDGTDMHSWNIDNRTITMNIDVDNKTSFSLVVSYIPNKDVDVPEVTLLKHFAGNRTLNDLPILVKE